MFSREWLMRYLGIGLQVVFLSVSWLLNVVNKYLQFFWNMVCLATCARKKTHYSKDGRALVWGIPCEVYRCYPSPFVTSGKVTLERNTSLSGFCSSRVCSSSLYGMWPSSYWDRALARKKIIGGRLLTLSNRWREIFCSVSRICGVSYRYCLRGCLSAWKYEVFYQAAFLRHQRVHCVNPSASNNTL